MPTSSFSTTRLVRSLALVAVGFLVVAPLGQAIPGAGTVGGFEKLRVDGCQKSDLLFGMETELEVDGDFVATSLFTGVLYEDLANVTIGRTVTLEPSATSLADIVAQWETDATAICFQAVTISNATSKSMQLRFSKKGFDAVFKANFEGDASGLLVSGKTTLSVEAKGPWFPGADLY